MRMAEEKGGRAVVAEVKGRERSSGKRMSGKKGREKEKVGNKGERMHGKREAGKGNGRKEKEKGWKKRWRVGRGDGKEKRWE